MPGAAAEAWAAWLLALGSAGAVAAAAPLPPLVDGAASALGEGWAVIGLPRQKPALTEFSAVQVDGRAAVAVRARASYGNLVHTLAVPLVPRRLAWSWRVDRPNPAADLSVRSGDDSAVRVCLSVDLPLERVPFVERAGLVMARAVSGLPLPAATLCWVWAAREAPGRVIENAYSRRVRYLVVRGAGDTIGRWGDESRDVAADFLRAFGDEAASLPPATAVSVAGDADDTGGASLAHVASLRWLP